MTCEQLQGLSKAQLIEIILRQQALSEHLQGRVAEFEKQIKRLTGPAKDWTNSSVSPSQTRKPNSSDQGNKKRGPKRGHQGHSQLRSGAGQSSHRCRDSADCHFAGSPLSGLPASFTRRCSRAYC